MSAAATPSDFRLYHSNALDVLAGLLAEQLREPVPGQSLLVPDTILIPQAAMRRWLQATLAQRHGVAANLEFRTPGEFVRQALDANPAPQEHAGDDLDHAALHWRLYAALRDARLLAQAPMAQIAGYLDDADPLKPWALAGELAGVFEKYQAWRRDWLLRWDRGADPDDPQAILWRDALGGHSHRARRIQAYLDRFEGVGQPLPHGLPRRLFVFATLNVSPDVLRVIATQARVGTLHFYVPSPAQDYWGDLQRLRSGQPRNGADDNRLLQGWGAAGRDFMAVIGGYELVHPVLDLRGNADPGDGGGAMHGSLLRRLQSDLFHRRATPAGPLLPQLRKDDPSLQVHASQTRLRELQVLHDQLRALLDDTRFDPPLQPREIAVLAPDIDPYVPYLDAVFGSGEDGNGDRIPYALADTSPLASEPLADVFLRLLELPVSRFGLNEILDLLASAPLADAAGLDTAAFERLHGWLQAGGARWGLDAAHRQQRDAPADDAYTWQFALDRLLLGHASGDGDDIAGVAPWPDLEGGALDALDVLLRLLRELARQQKRLGEAATPAQWRERLLGLLRAVLPQEPADPVTRRTLDRLRLLVDAFGKSAAQAQVELAVPADVVRAHFAHELGQADTRAPLLTGGISIGRMVPMRLLPFRVICLLGMNDGDFPRRDPAAGLNRLTAELGSDKRRPGDRSTRDDDRFLFLQLFCAAQDVFYLSYLGADPRDGSMREPSLLVSELLDAAAQQHADAGMARDALVVRHPLQPFSAAAFGDADEPRRFSYRRQWHPAADVRASRRVALPPWFDGHALPALALDDGELSIDSLRRFLSAPAEQFLQQRLGMRLPGVAVAGQDVEPLQMPARGLERHRLQMAVLDALLRGEDIALTRVALRARGLLPSGALGRRTLEQVHALVQPYAQAFSQWRGDSTPDVLQVQQPLDDVLLRGAIDNAHAHGIARIRIGAPSGPSVIRNGLDWLLAGAGGSTLPLVEFHDGGDAGVGPHVRAPADPRQARDALASLLALRVDGLREPLPFAPYSGWQLYTQPDLERGLARAAAQWRGGDRQWGEGDSDALRLALRGRDPFVDAQACAAFVDATLRTFIPLTAGRAPDAAELEAGHASIAAWLAGDDA